MTSVHLISNLNRFGVTEENLIRRDIKFYFFRCIFIRLSKENRRVTQSFDELVQSFNPTL